MIPVFAGRHENKVDSKARLSIPADFRKILETADDSWADGKPARMWLIVSDKRQYIEVVSTNWMGKAMRKILKMQKGSHKRRRLEIMYFQCAHECAVDNAGRIVLPPAARAHLGVAGGDTVAVLGTGEHFELWTPAAYEAANGQGLQLSEDDDFDPNLDPSAYLPPDDDDDVDFDV